MLTLSCTLLNLGNAVRLEAHKLAHNNMVLLNIYPTHRAFTTNASCFDTNYTKLVHYARIVWSVINIKEIKDTLTNIIYHACIVWSVIDLKDTLTNIIYHACIAWSVIDADGTGS